MKSFQSDGLIESSDRISTSHCGAFEQKDVLVFAQLNRQFFDILIDYLYARNAKKSNGSALLWAAGKGYESTARQALANGAKPSATNRKGDTSLHLATNAGNLSMARFY